MYSHEEVMSRSELLRIEMWWLAFAGCTAYRVCIVVLQRSLPDVMTIYSKRTEQTSVWLFDKKEGKCSCSSHQNNGCKLLHIWNKWPAVIVHARLLSLVFLFIAKLCFPSIFQDVGNCCRAIRVDAPALYWYKHPDKWAQTMGCKYVTHVRVEYLPHDRLHSAWVTSCSVSCNKPGKWKALQMH